MAAYYQEGTVKGKGENLEEELENISKKLKKAMRGLGTDEKAIIEVLGGYSNEQLQKIKQSYKNFYGRDLEKDLECELAGNFEKICLNRLVPSREYDAKCLRHAMKGFETNESTLIEILCSHSNTEIHDIKREYNRVFGRDLEDDIKAETSGDLQRILVSLVQGCRDEDQLVDDAKVARDVQDLIEAGTKKFGTDESVFNKILVQRSFSHLLAVFEAYRKETQEDLEYVIGQEMSGDVASAFKSIVSFIKDRAEFYANCFHETLKGPGTDDERLIQLVISHCEIDMKCIERKYMDLYDKGLSLAIEEDTSGDYRKLLLKLAKEE